ncbi:Selenoprotein F [Lamellibrachia satsuma]|nr:Selenoprotein F [Lamellibrachia satsuma]
MSTAFTNMAAAKELWLYLISFAFFIVHSCCDELSALQCQASGFSTKLMCSSCNELDQFMLHKLKEPCYKCCQDDSSLSSPNPLLPHAEIVSDRMQRWSGLRVRYMRGADPVIKLMNEERTVVETLSIEKWNTDSIEEFFEERLKK